MKRSVLLCVNHMITTIETEVSFGFESALTEFMSFYIPNYRHMPLYNRFSGGKRVWDGKKHFYNKKLQQFPTGLLPVVLRICKIKGYPVHVKDCRGPLMKWTRLMSSRELYNKLVEMDVSKVPSLQKCRYQREAALAVKRSMLDGIMEHEPLKFRRGVIAMGTGAGKTLTAALMVSSLPHDARVFYTINRLELADQTRAAWKAFLGEEIGLIGEGKFEPQRITVCLVQSFAQALKKPASKSKDTQQKQQKFIDFLGQQKAWIADEAHHADSPTYVLMAEYLKKTEVRIGFSGSVMLKPLNKSSLGDATLHAVLGPKLYTLEASTLRDEGLLSNITVRIVEGQEAPRNFKKKTAYPTVYAEGIVQNIDRNMKIVELLHTFITQKSPTLVICAHIKQCKTLRDLLLMIYPDDVVACLMGSTPMDERRTELVKFKKGELFGIIASTIFDEGIDIPDAERLIMAAGGEGGDNGAQTLQRVGRVSRVKASQVNHAYVYDFDDLEPLFLSKHFKSRLKLYKKEKYTIEYI